MTRAAGVLDEEHRLHALHIGADDTGQRLDPLLNSEL
jgi:hypothetical protein